MTGTFIDTPIICTLTGLTILATGVWSGDLNGVAFDPVSLFNSFFTLWACPLDHLPCNSLPLRRFSVGTTTENAVLSFSSVFDLSGFTV